MQSIAPDTVHIEVTGEGVVIGGVKCPVGWKGDVKRTTARYLLNAKMAKPASVDKPAAPQEPVDAKPAVEYDAQEPAKGEEAAPTPTRGNRVQRTRNS